MPVWRFATGRFVLEKRVHMDQGANVTRIDYANLWSREPLALSLRVITDHRDYHGRTFAWDGAPAPVADGDTLSIPAGGTADLHVRLENGRAEASGTWYRGFDLPQERARGLTDSEDHVFAGTVSATLAPGNTVQLVANCAARPAAIDRGAHAAGRAREQSLLGAWHAARGADAAPAPDWVRQLVLAADQFIVGRRLPDGEPTDTSVIAGYPWFADWGRDTMISLPGLTLATGRPEIAAQSCARLRRRRGPRACSPTASPTPATRPEYNTVDATLWYFEAIRAYHAATGDTALARDLFPVLAGHRRLAPPRHTLRASTSTRRTACSTPASQGCS